MSHVPIHTSVHTHRSIKIEDGIDAKPQRPGLRHSRLSEPYNGPWMHSGTVLIKPGTVLSLHCVPSTNSHRISYTVRAAARRAAGRQTYRAKQQQSIRIKMSS